MMTYDLRHLINGNKMKFPVSSEMKLIINALDELIEKMGISDFTPYDYFVAGYILANPVVREILTRNKKHELKKDGVVTTRRY